VNNSLRCFTLTVFAAITIRRSRSPRKDGLRVADFVVNKIILNTTKTFLSSNITQRFVERSKYLRKNSCRQSIPLIHVFYQNVLYSIIVFAEYVYKTPRVDLLVTIFSLHDFYTYRRDHSVFFFTLKCIKICWTQCRKTGCAKWSERYWYFIFINEIIHISQNAWLMLTRLIFMEIF
jgi:hypothetical protein